MKLELRPSLQTEQSLEQRLQNRQEMRQELTQRMTHDIFEIYDESVSPPKETLKHVISKVASYMPEGALRDAIPSIFEDELLRDGVLQQAERLTKPTRRAVTECISKYFYDSHRGEFVFAAESEETASVGESTKLPYGVYHDAIVDPDKLEKELKNLQELAKLTGAQAGTLQSMNEMRTAKLVAETSAEERRLLEKLLEIVLIQKQPERSNAAPLLQDFLSEFVIFRRLAFTLSERIQKRFASSFMRAKRGQADRLQNAFLNTVGEYTLVSMGVIDPEIFQLHTREIDKNDANELRESLAESGVNYDEVCKKYALKSEGRLFWNRWKTLDLKMSAGTDEKVRAFITQSVRKEAQTILQTADYDNLFSEICDAKEQSEDGSKEAIAQLQDAYREILVQHLNQDSFKETIKSLIKERWYPEIRRFYGKKTQEHLQETI